MAKLGTFLENVLKPAQAIAMAALLAVVKSATSVAKSVISRVAALREAAMLAVPVDMELATVTGVAAVKLATLVVVSATWPGTALKAKNATTVSTIRSFFILLLIWYAYQAAGNVFQAARLATSRVTAQLKPEASVYATNASSPATSRRLAPTKRSDILAMDAVCEVQSRRLSPFPRSSSYAVSIMSFENFIHPPCHFSGSGFVLFFFIF